MKWIHIIFGLNMGGIAAMIQNFVESMPEEDSVVLIIFRVNENPDIQERFKVLLNHPRVSVFDLKKRLKRDHIKTIVKLRSILKNNKHHIVLSHLEEVSRYVLLSKIGLKIPVFQIIHNDVFHDFTLHKIIMKYVFKGYIFVSEQAYLKYRNLKHTSMTWIRNGIVFEQRELKQRYGWVFVGRMEQQKQPLKCIQYYHKAIEGIDSPPPLKMIGSGILLQEVSDYIKLHNLDNQVTIIEKSANIIEIFASSSLALMTSLYEGTPMVMLEALSQGCPYIAFDVGGVSAILNDSNGYLINSLDEDSYITTLKSILQNDEDLRFKQQSSAQSIQSFSAEKMVNHYSNWIKKQLNYNNENDLD
jgi:glycosyltransferase involved in cell wall biosynthesis